MGKSELASALLTSIVSSTMKRQTGFVVFCGGRSDDLEHLWWIVLCYPRAAACQSPSRGPLSALKVQTAVTVY